MRIITITILLLFSVATHAAHELTGLWEGYKYQGNSYSSQILELDENGKGFYAYTVGEEMDANLVFPVNLSNVIFENGYLIVNFKHPNAQHTLIISEDMGTKLSVLTIFSDPKGKPFFSIPWYLTPVHNNIRNKSLYEFATNLFNE